MPAVKMRILTPADLMTQLAAAAHERLLYRAQVVQIGGDTYRLTNQCEAGTIRAPRAS